MIVNTFSLSRRAEICMFVGPALILKIEPKFDRE